ncbi:hypothetical protein B7494_g7661 [Chlorociboria aeruginascens]|nr:hypothetical protein B7494_g7661 [Chlorociboria aeruginascens]
MSGYPISIITYDRGEQWDDPSKKKPYHWAFFLQTGSVIGVGHMFQLRGMPGSFYYPGEENGDVSKSEPGKNGQLEVGVVPSEKYDRFKQALQAVPVNNVEASGWNCQSWCLAALDCLRSEGLIADGYPNHAIQYWLREDQ